MSLPASGEPHAVITDSARKRTNVTNGALGRHAAFLGGKWMSCVEPGLNI
jgi:hypothetical protein